MCPQQCVLVYQGLNGMRNPRDASLKRDVWEIANFTHKGDWEIQCVPYNPGELAYRCNLGKKGKSVSQKCQMIVL